MPKTLKIAENYSVNLNLLIVFFIYGYGNKRCEFEELVVGIIFYRFEAYFVQ